MPSGGEVGLPWVGQVNGQDSSLARLVVTHACTLRCCQHAPPPHPLKPHRNRSPPPTPRFALSRRHAELFVNDTKLDSLFARECYSEMDLTTWQMKPG